MDYKEIYKNWDTFPDCKMHITGESIWGKVLPDGTYGINNTPLSNVYQWQDIVRSKELPEDEAQNLIIHRRWKLQLHYRYEEPEGATKEESAEQRLKIYDVLKPLGDPGFWCSGVGYILFEEDLIPEEAFEIIKKPLADAGITISKAE